FEAPASGVRATRTASEYADVAQLVAHHLAKVRVASSSLVIRSDRAPVIPESPGLSASVGGLTVLAGTRTGLASTPCLQTRVVRSVVVTEPTRAPRRKGATMNPLLIIIAVIAIILAVTGGLVQSLNFLLWVGLVLLALAVIAWLIRAVSGRNTSV